MNSQIWGRNTFGQFTNEAVDVEVDASGNSYITGYLTGETAFQTDVVVLNGYSGDAYVAKYNSTGALIWVKTFGGNFSDRATDLAIGPDGNIVFTGQFFGTANFGSISLTSPAGSKDIFIAKLDPAGNVIWAIREGGTDAENAYGVTVDHQNNVLLTGQFKGNSTIAGQTFTSTIDPLTSLPSFDFFVAKYDSNGNPLWIRNGVADYEDRGLAVSVDDQDNVFMTGQFSDTLQFCGNTYNNMSYNLGFVTKLSPTGNLIFFNRIQAGMSVPWDVKVDEENKVVVAGDFLGNMNYIDQTGLHPITNPYSKQGFLIKLENDGSYIWDYTIGSENPFSLKSIAIDIHEDIYATGWFECTLSQTHDTITELWNSVGFRDPYLLKVGKLGTHNYIKQFGGQLDDEGHGVALLQNDQAVVCGMFKQDLSVSSNSTSLPVIPSVSANSYLNNYYGYGSFYHMNGDKSANSFLLAAVDENSEDYNYFVLPNDSLSGFISPSVDTLHLCFGELIGWASQTIDISGPAYNYLWNTGDTTSSIYVNLTGEYSIYVERIDECHSDRDTIFVQMEEIPPLPYLTDNHGINDSTINYNNLNFCYPEPIQFYFDSLPNGVDLFFTSYSYPYVSFDQDTNFYGTYTDSIATNYYIQTQNEYCLNASQFFLNYQFPIVYDSIYLGIIMNTPSGPNDSIEICLGEYVNFIGIDYITNPNGNFDAIDEPYVDFNYNIDDEVDTIMSIHQFTTTGWKYVELDLILGYDNLCGLDTTHYHAVDSFYVKVNPLPTFNTVLEGDNLLCPNGSVFITTSNTDPNLQWGPSYGIVWTSTDGDSIEVSEPGTYYYSGSFIDSTTQCSDYFSFSFDVQFKQPPIIVSDPEDGIICPNDSVLFTLPNTYIGYAWIGPNNDTLSTTNTCYGTEMGSYYCHLIDDEGCPMATLPVQLNEYSTPSIFIYPDPFICPGEEVTIGVAYSGEPTFVWHPNGEITDEIVVTQAGVYFVEIEQCGFTVNDSIEIIDGGFTATISVNDTLLCANEDAVFIGSYPTGTYQWNNNEITGASYQTDDEGLYFAFVTNEYGCETQTNTIEIEFVENSDAPDVSDVSICPGSDATIISNALTYWYNTDTTLVETANSIVLSSVLTDTVVLAAYVQNECPILYTEVLINVQDSIESTGIFMDSLLCANESTTAFVISNGIDFEWSINGNFIGVSNPITIPSIYIGNGGIITVQIDNSCMQMLVSDSFEIAPLTQISIDEDTLYGCIDDLVQLSINETLSSVVWSDGINSDTLSIYETEFDQNPLVVSVQGIDLNGCPTNELQYTLITSNVSSNFTYSSLTNCLNDSAIIVFNTNADSFLITTPFGQIDTAYFEIILNSSTTGSYNAWYLDSLGCEYTETLVVSPYQLPIFDLGTDTVLCIDDIFTFYFPNDTNQFVWTTYGGDENIPILSDQELILTATSPQGCVFSDSLFVLTVDCDDELPNVITSNGDGINDFFFIDDALVYTSSRLIILNRYGQVVFSADGYQNDWSGQDCVEGVYFYQFYPNPTLEPNRFINGFVQLFK
ncbi:MAG: gliding motility-associated C-terminal domain-containing protein [Fluviicola sp.]